MFQHYKKGISQMMKMQKMKDIINFKNRSSLPSFLRAKFYIIGPSTGVTKHECFVTLLSITHGSKLPYHTSMMIGCSILALVDKSFRKDLKEILKQSEFDVREVSIEEFKNLYSNFHGSTSDTILKSYLDAHPSFYVLALCNLLSFVESSLPSNDVSQGQSNSCWNKYYSVFGLTDSDTVDYTNLIPSEKFAFQFSTELMSQRSVKERIFRSIANLSQGKNLLSTGMKNLMEA